jgi:hypothetical protein
LGQESELETLRHVTKWQWEGWVRWLVPVNVRDSHICLQGLGDDPPLETKRDGKRRRGAPRRRPPPRAGDDEDAEDEGSGSDEEDVHAWIEADAE